MESPSCFYSTPLLLPCPPPPSVSLSRQKGPDCHVVDQPANMRAPPHFQPPVQVGGWGPEALLGVCVVRRPYAEAGEVRREGGGQRVLEEFGGVTVGSVSGTLFQSWCREALVLGTDA